MPLSLATRRILLALGLGLGVLSVAACDNPADSKPKATVTDVKPAATTAGTAAPTTAAAGTVALALDPATSKIAFTGSKVTGHHDGSFAKFTGKVDYAAARPETSRITVDIDADSLTTNTEKLTGHLKSPDFFDTAKFPKASFVSKEIKVGGAAGATHTITGDLTLHGVTKSISFPATVTAGPDSFKATSEFSINRKDFGLVYAGKADDLIRDDVLIKLTLDAKKQ